MSEEKDGLWEQLTEEKLKQENAKRQVMELLANIGGRTLKRERE